MNRNLALGIGIGVGGAGLVAVLLITLVGGYNAMNPNTEIIQQQEARLNQLEIDQQLERELDVCKNHALVYDFDSFYNCMDGVIRNPNYYFDPQALENYKMERDRHFAQGTSINLANCNLTPSQQMQIDALKNDDSIDPQVALTQTLQIMQQACR